ncbi:MAG: GxxExxY protein [Planctomycetaceae bacterium]
MAELVFAQEAFQIIGACFEVYNQMGTGFPEAVYQECLELEMTERGIPFVAHGQLRLSYKGKELQQIFIPDFFCFDRIIVEIKATTDLCNEHRAQVHNYLKATGQRLGMLVNFGHRPLLEYERIVR